MSSTDVSSAHGVPTLLPLIDCALISNASQDSSLLKLVASVALATAIFLMFKTKALRSELANIRAEKTVVQWSLTNARDEKTSIERELATTREVKTTIENRLLETQQALRKAGVPLRFQYFQDDVPYKKPKPNSRAVLLTGFAKAPGLDAVLSKVTTGGIEAITCHRQRFQDKEFYHVVIVFLDAIGASTFVTVVRRQAPPIKFDDQEVGISYIACGTHSRNEELFKGINEQGWSRVLVIAIPSPLVLVDGVGGAPQGHGAHQEPKNQQYWNLFSEEEAQSITELQHIDADNKDIIKICRVADGDGERTHFLIYVQYTSVVAAVESASAMRRNHCLRDCQMRFAADPCGDYIRDGIKRIVGNIQNGAPLSNPVPPPRLPPRPSYPVRPTFHAEFNPPPQ